MKKLTPKKVGERYGVTPVTVLDWINSGLMPATDCSRSTASRKRWRMDEDDLAEFDKRRSAKKKIAAARQRVKAEESGAVYV
jgi:predicted site-specific integrase-resolvase